MYSKMKTENRKYQVLLMQRSFVDSSVLDQFSLAMWKYCNCLFIRPYSSNAPTHAVVSCICINMYTSFRKNICDTSDSNLHFVEGCRLVITSLQSYAFCALIKLKPSFKIIFPVCWKCVSLKVIILYCFICHIMSDFLLITYTIFKMLQRKLIFQIKGEWVLLHDLS